MIKHVSSIALFLIASLLPLPGDHATGKAGDLSVITIESPSPQAKARLLKQWQELPEELRKRIVSEVVAGRRLGLSSTGTVELIGVYSQLPGNGDRTKPKRLFHLRQTDLFGGRLFWSVLLDPENETFKILYHINQRNDSSWLNLGGE